MKRTKRALVVGWLVVLALPAAAAPGPGAPPGLPVQLELGDSWTYGQGATDPAVTGYAGQFFAGSLEHIDCVPASARQAVDGCRNLRRIIFARPASEEQPGVTTDLLIQEQLDEATSIVGRRNADANPNNDVMVIVISVGGNDVSAPVLQACLGGLSPDCLAVIGERIAHVDANLDFILGSLRDAAGGDTRIVITTYDNPIPFCSLGSIPGAAELGALTLEGHPALGIAGLNDVIRANAAAHDVLVADTFGRLGAGQWVGGADCLHPSQAGHDEIADIATEAAYG